METSWSGGGLPTASYVHDDSVNSAASHFSEFPNSMYIRKRPAVVFTKWERLITPITIYHLFVYMQRCYSNNTSLIMQLCHALVLFLANYVLQWRHSCKSYPYEYLPTLGRHILKIEEVITEASLSKFAPRWVEPIEPKVLWV
jgi:hypothetical protein